MQEILYDHLTADQLHAYCLVLDAYGLPYAADVTSEGGRIRVAAQTHAIALDLVQKYIRENPDPTAPETPPALSQPKTYSAVWVCLLLLTAHLAIHMAADTEAVIRAYGASAARIMQGEVYRVVTALMIHSDVAHLAGNVAGLAVLGTLIGRMSGPGVGWLTILLSGMAGNLINALFYRQGHISIGASTAVFGALGVLAAGQFHHKLKSNRRDQRQRAWLPLAGGLALLGFLGTGANADLLAHLFGLSAGFFFGMVYTLVLRPHVQEKHQAYGMALAAAIVALSWLRPFERV